MLTIRMTETAAALIEIPFTTVLASNLQTRVLGATLANASIVVKIKQGGVTTVVAGGAGTFTPVDDTGAPGVRGYRPTVGERSLGVSTFVFTGTGIEPREVTVRFVNEDPYRVSYFGVVGAGTSTTSMIFVDRTEVTTDQFKDDYITFHTGACKGATKRIGSFTPGSPATVGLATSSPIQLLPAAPSPGDIYEILTR